MVVVVAEFVTPEGPANRKVIGATTVDPAGETVGGIATTCIADSLMHVHEKSLAQELALVAAEVGSLGIVVAEWCQCLKQNQVVYKDLHPAPFTLVVPFAIAFLYQILVGPIQGCRVE
jgi:hypothetical protein